MKDPPVILQDRTPDQLLAAMLARKVDFVAVVADRNLSSSDSEEIIHQLCSAAAEIGQHHVISELGQARSIADDPLKNVPKVRPVKVVKVIRQC